MVASELSPRVCSYCGDAPCEWQQYGPGIIGSRIRMITCTKRRLTPGRVKRTLSQLYYYKRNGRMCKTTRIELPLCVANEITRLNNTIRRVCAIGSPDAAAQTASSAERIVSEVELSASW
ncbi:hypothetical protein PI124_g11666 [Phytophthora idaei]|nr:hypothetical protein PI124_g11666 [Phytophthora idaei]